MKYNTAEKVLKSKAVGICPQPVKRPLNGYLATATVVVKEATVVATATIVTAATVVSR